MGYLNTCTKAQLIEIIERERKSFREQMDSLAEYARQREARLEARVAELEKQTPGWLAELQEALIFTRRYLRELMPEMESRPFLDRKREMHREAIETLDAVELT